MSDAIPLPPRPNLEQYKKIAKDLQHACKSSDPGAIRAWGSRWAENTARLSGSEFTPELQRQIAFAAERMEQRWGKFNQTNQRTACALTDAQLFIAREHGFASWPKFAKHVEAVAHAHSPVSNFEAAADAIVSGDLEGLKKSLRDDPALVRARSTREHHSTLLHYVSANGVEDFRQKTPRNILEVAKLLLDTGADVHAESNAYGGGSTTLGLVATSAHPERAGVQDALMTILLDRGARLDHPGNRQKLVNLCLANGRGKAAEFLARRDPRLDLEVAAGVGRLDLVKNHFNDEGRPKPGTRKQIEDGFAWACEFGRTAVVDFLLQKGVPIGAKLRHDGQTGLHWAAYGGHAETVKLLLHRGAAIDVRDQSYGGTPLDWALYAWNNSPESPERYYQVVALLVQAGARLDAEVDDDRRHAAEKIRSDPRMVAALRGERSDQ